MDATKKAIEENLDVQESLIKAIRADYWKMSNGVKATVPRMRKAQMNLSKVAKATRALLIEYKCKM